MRFHVSNSEILEAVVIIEVVGRPCFGLHYAKESLKLNANECFKIRRGFIHLHPFLAFCRNLLQNQFAIRR